MRYEDDGFDPTPYDRILAGIHVPARPAEEADALNVFEADSIINIEEEDNKEFEASIDTPQNVQNDNIAEIDKSQAINQIPDESTGAVSDEIEESPESFRNGEIAESTVASESDESTENSEATEAAETAETARGIEIEYTDLKDIKEKGTVMPLGNSLVSSELAFTDIRSAEPARVYIEEDILVPDIKPDMAKILSMSGSIKCTDKEAKASQKGEDLVKVTGDITLKTIYIPEFPAGGSGAASNNDANTSETIVTIQSRVPLRADWSVSVAPNSAYVVKPEIENIEYMVINERKFRAKLTLRLTMKEYAGRALNLFEGIKGEEVQLLKEKVTVTDILSKKKDIIDINEEIALKDNCPTPVNILRSDINIVQNHKQITSEKAVISGSVYYSVLYMADPDDVITEGKKNQADAETENADISKSQPLYFYQGKTEFTQFIPIDSTEGLSGSRITLDGSDLSIRIKNSTDARAVSDARDKEDDALDSINENGAVAGRAFMLEGNISTTLEMYRNIEKEIVTDAYHNEKDLVYESSDFSVKSISGSGMTEISAREILNIPDRYGDVDQVIYISGKVKDSSCTTELGKEIVSGNISVEVLALAADKNHTPFKMEYTIPFRGIMEIPATYSGMSAESEVCIKDLWFDKINGKQIEINAGICAYGTVYANETYKLIENPAFAVGSEGESRGAGMILYISRPKDNLWKIAKKFRTTIETISRVNGIEKNAHIDEGTKLLIVK